MARKWNWVAGYLAIALVLGIAFRFVNLDGLIYWHDETSTSLRISGYTKTEFVRRVAGSDPISVAQLHRRYQSPNPTRDLSHTLDALASKPEHPPLYYLLARFWAQGFGSSVTAMRALPAIISVLAFPAMYWLAVELFAAPPVGWVAMALVAVSPIHVLYAKEAREYSLWIVTIVLSSAALLKALRRDRWLDWSLYALTLALGLYSHLLYVFVGLSHGIYVLWRRRIGRFVLALAAALVAFSPWLAVMLSRMQRLETINAQLDRQADLSYLVGKWFLHFNRLFHEIDFGSVNWIFFLFSLYAIYVACRQNFVKSGLFIALLFGVTALGLAIPDLLEGGHRSVRTRYLMPCYLAVELAMANLLVTGAIASRKVWQQRVWRGLGALLVTMGVVSGIVIVNSQTAWSKNDELTQNYPEVAEVVNGKNRPLLASDTDPNYILSLSYLLDPNVSIQFIGKPEIFSPARSFDPVFVYNPSIPLAESLQSQFAFRIAIETKRVQLWEFRLSE